MTSMARSVCGQNSISVVSFAVSLAAILIGLLSVQSEGTLSSTPVGLADTLELLDGKLRQQVAEDSGVNRMVAAIPGRVEVLINDKIEGYKENSCVEYQVAGNRPAAGTRIQFVEAGDKLGLTAAHRTQKPVRPYCRFDFSLPIFNSSAVAKVKGEFCEAELTTGGVAVADYDNDGLLDVYLTAAEGRSALYKNIGGTFKDVAAEVGVGPLKLAAGAAWVDIDTDGDLDLYVTTTGDTRHYLYINRGGIFTEEAVVRGLSLTMPDKRRIGGTTPNIGDFDRDGYPDIYVSEWFLKPRGQPSASVLMRNRGKAAPGYFEDVTKAAGIDMEVYDGNSINGTYTFCSSFTDLDNDGWGDLLITADNDQTRLWWNNHNGTFTQCTKPCGLNIDKTNAMGQAMGDWDQDGRMDWFMTAITFKSCESLSCTIPSTGNRFHRNLGNRRLQDYTDEVGVRDGGWGWGAAMMDFNNDRWLDFVNTNGFDVGTTTVDDHTTRDPTKLWESLGPAFNYSTKERAAHYGLNHTAEGRGLVKVDIDDDGDEDIIIVNHLGKPSVYVNEGGNQNNWLKVTVKNRCPSNASRLCDSLGATVHVRSSDGYTQMAEVGSGSQYMAQESLTVHFGLGSLQSDVSVRIKWPGLQKEVNISNVPRNTKLKILAPL